MAGGRPPKTSAELKLYGGFRKDRHGSRAEFSASEPVKPGLGKIASAIWDLVVNGLPLDAKSAIDAPALEGMCRWYGVFAEYMGKLESDTGDYRVLMMASIAWKQFESAAAKFGLTPVDRAKLKVPAKDSGADEFEKFLEQHA